MSMIADLKLTALRTIALLAAALALLGCADPGTYPISGQECGPEDPVQTISPAECRPPV